MTMNLNKAVALVTGGACGLGRNISETLLKKGANVVVADINVKAGNQFEHQSASQYGDNRLKFIRCDVSNQHELHDTFVAAKLHFGHLDIVCNNAGIGSVDSSIARKQIDINLTAVVEGTYLAIDLMSKQRGGDGGLVVNIASAAGLDLLKMVPVYTATKQGVVSFTRCFDRLPHHAEDGVRVNCLCPFFFESALVTEGLLESAKFGRLIEKLGGYIQMEDVVKGFMKCVDDPSMNGESVVIAPPDKIFTMKFPKANL